MKTKDILKDIENITKSSKNTKYSTMNGVKEIVSKQDGYIDDINIQGETLINLCGTKVTKYTVNESSFDYGTDSNILLSDSFITIFNLAKDRNIRIITRDKSNHEISTIIVNALETKVIYIPSTHELWTTRGGTLEGWDVDEETLYSQSIVILKGDYSSRDIKYFEGLTSIGQNDKLEILSYTKGTKNIDISNIVWKDNSYINVNGNEQSHPYVCRSLNNIEVESNTTYIIENTNSNITQYDHNNNFIYTGLPTIFGLKSKNYSNCIDFIIFTTTNKTKYINITTNIEAKKLISINSVKYDKKDILTTLRSLPSGEKDEIFKMGNKYYRIKRCIEKTYYGGEPWANTISQYSSEKIISFVIRDVCTNKQIISNRFDTISDPINNPNPLNEYICCDSNNINANWFVVGIDKTRLKTQDINGFKEWLKDNPLTVMYNLATPIIEEIPDINPIIFEGNSTILFKTGSVQGEASFESTNSVRSELDVLKNKVSNIDNTFIKQDIYSEMLYNGFYECKWAEYNNMIGIIGVKFDNIILLNGFLGFEGTCTLNTPIAKLNIVLNKKYRIDATLLNADGDIVDTIPFILDKDGVITCKKQFTSDINKAISFNLSIIENR